MREGGGGQSQGSESETKEEAPVFPSSGTCRKCGPKVCLEPGMKGHVWYRPVYPSPGAVSPETESTLVTARGWEREAGGVTD